MNPGTTPPIPPGGPPAPPAAAGSTRDPVGAWRSPLLRLVLILLTFLTLSGLVIYLMPTSRTGLAVGQYSVILHTVLGALFVAPCLVDLARHFLAIGKHPVWYVAVVGYAGGAALLLTVVSGVVLTVEAVAGIRISRGWDLVHTTFGLGMGVLVVLHLVVAAIVRGRSRGEGEGAALRLAAGRTAAISLGAGTVLCLLAAAPALVYRGAPKAMAFPADHGYKYGDNPFAPSLATTGTGGAIHPAALSGSKRCGESGCHEEIVKEWEPSAHRAASRSYFFQLIQKTMAGNNGPESTRYCGGCHDPIALFSGARNIYDQDLSSPGADEGVSCAACHSIVRADVKGNASYTLVAPDRYLFEEFQSPAARLVSRFLIRALPAPHVKSYSRDLLKTPEFCGACHEQFIDKEINRVGWVQIQNQYDNWRKSHWFKGTRENPQVADPERTITCRECHMRLSDSRDPASGDAEDYNRSPSDGKHRNHRFIGANQWQATLQKLPGAEEQVRLTEEWLQGKTEIPEIAGKWAKGPAVPIELILPRKAAPGEEVSVRAITSSSKVGHDFPTGPLDIIQCWVEILVTDAAGQPVFQSGVVDARGFIQEGSFLFKAEGVDQAGNLIDRHNLWDLVGARFRRSLFPGFSDTAEYRFACPSASLGHTSPLQPEREFKFKVPPGASDALVVKARLRYRKVDQTLIEFLQPGGKLTAPITDISTAEGTIPVGARP